MYIAVLIGNIDDDEVMDVFQILSKPLFGYVGMNVTDDEVTCCSNRDFVGDVTR